MPDPPVLEIWATAAKRIIGRASLDTIGKYLYELGLRGPRGGRLLHSALRNLLTNPALVGRVTYRDDGKGDRPRHQVTANWPPMVDVELFELVAARLAERAPRGEGRQRRRRELYPLTPVCAHCGCEYNGGRDKVEQGRSRYYTHAKPRERANP